MASEISKEIGRLLMSYSGPEPERVRMAIVKLAKDDLQKTEHYVNRAQGDYPDVLWWADIQEEEDRKKESLAGMTVNERLSCLTLFSEWDAAVARGDQKSASVILQKCALSDADIKNVLDAEFNRADQRGRPNVG